MIGVTAYELPTCAAAASVCLSSLMNGGESGSEKENARLKLQLKI